jgi:hypothetical protein
MNAVQINKLYKNCGSDADITDLDVDIDDLLKKMGRTRTRIWKNTTLADIHADILTALNSLDGIKPSALKSSRQTNALPVRGRVERDHLGKPSGGYESQNRYGTYYLTDWRVRG